MVEDKKTIGLTAANNDLFQKLVRAGRFSSEMDAAKFAMAYAIRQGAKPGAAEGTATKWNQGSIDPDGSLVMTIKALYPETEGPFRLIEFLINEGLRMLRGQTDLPPDVARIVSEASTPAAD